MHNYQKLFCITVSMATLILTGYYNYIYVNRLIPHHNYIYIDR